MPVPHVAGSSAVRQYLEHDVERETGGKFLFTEDVEQAAAAGQSLPDVLGGKKAYSPAFYSTGIFVASILIGICAGLITGCIGAGGGFIIAPALMSAGIKGILAVGTDLFHIFAKAIMGSVIHRKLGNVSVPLAVVFLIGAVIGATVGGLINRGLYELNPVISDAFITTIYSVMLGFLGFYALFDFLKARGAAKKTDAPKGTTAHHGGKAEGTEMGGLPRKLQGVKIPPMVRFDYDLVPGGRSISWVFLVASGGTVLFFGAPDQDGETRIPFPEIWRREITLQTSYGAAPADLATAIELIRTRRVPVAEMVTHRYPLAGIGEAFRAVASGGESIKVIVEP